MTVIAMSRTEIDRMSVLHDLADGRIRIAEASTLIGLGRRQVFRLAKARTASMDRRRWCHDGVAGRATVAIRWLWVPK
jgi:hypothetical protein